jgi:uncharacterized protein YneF (UPF0154 family)
MGRALNELAVADALLLPILVLTSSLLVGLLMGALWMSKRD